MINQVSTQNYETFVKESKEMYIFNSKRIENKIKQFKEKISILNKKSGEIKVLNHNPLQEQKDSYLWFINNIMKTTEQLKDEYTCIFLTISLPSKFHQFVKKTKKLNIRYREKNSITKGYELLNKTIRTIYKNFKINRKWEKTYITRVVEPHHDFTPHLHGLIFVKTEYLEQMLNHIKNILKHFKMGKQKDIQVMRDTKKGIGYISKYIRKTQNPKDEETFHLMNGWKKTNKIRVFTIPQNFINRFIFKKINTILGLSKELKNKNVIDEMLEKCEIKMTTSKYDNDDKFVNDVVKTYKNSKNIYQVEIKRDRLQRKKYTENIEMINDVYDIDYEKLENGYFKQLTDNIFFIREKDAIEIIDYYKVTSFIIKKGDKIIYDKKDFEVLT